MLEFKNKDVAGKFESLVEKDRTVHKAGVYSGHLSNITPAMAEAMVKQNSNLIKEKTAGSKSTTAGAGAAAGTAAGNK